MKKSCIPNIFTFINLSCGVLSILYTFEKNYLFACFFILIAAFVDRYDGRVARWLNVSSELGKELDSLADLVSFGVAPSILTFLVYNLSDFGPFGLLGTIVLLCFPICGAYRLARYNTSTFDGVFTGIPITVAGSVVAIFVFFTLNKSIHQIVPVLLLILGSYLMVSTFKLKKM